MATSSLEIDSADILRLIEHHLTECGLHISCRTLREESGVGATATHSNLKSLCETGRWGDVLEVLSSLDAKRNLLPPDLIADVHEMAILELADGGEMDLAVAALRLSTDDLNNRTGSIEKRMASLQSLRGRTSDHNDVPPGYYGDDNASKQKRRDDIGRRLGDTVPAAPRGRLIALLQQAVKWQAHTGQLATNGREEDDEDEGREEEGDGASKKKRKKRKRKHFDPSSFDIVLGEASISHRASSHNTPSSTSSALSAALPPEKIPVKETGRIKLGKKTHPECAMFLPDGFGLVTGSSDGFIEIWDPVRWGKLRTHDLPYQQNDEIMLHENGAVTALAHSRDGELIATGDFVGTVKIWKVKDGRCLREFEKAHDRGISCVAFGREGSSVMTGGRDCLVREFGLKAARMLKQFQGHESYVNTCEYVYEDGGSVWVLTGSADGTVIVWDGSTAEKIRTLDPYKGKVDDQAAPGGLGRNIHTVLAMHAPAKTVVVVPRGNKAFLMNYAGIVLRTYERDDKRGEGGDFVAGMVSPSNKWLYLATEDGKCICFDVGTCDVIKMLDLGLEEDAGEITGICHHPHQGMFACFSNDKRQRGILRLWK